MRIENITIKVPAKRTLIKVESGILRTWERPAKATMVLVEKGRVCGGWEVWLN